MTTTMPPHAGWSAPVSATLLRPLGAITDAAGGGCVFVVDDDAGVRRALARLLRSRGFEVTTHPSAENLLENPPRGDRPCCLVVDLRLPGLGGLELHDRLARMGVSIPAVFVSGYADVPTSVQAMKAGAVDFIEKPVEGAVLVTAVRAALERHAGALRKSVQRQALEARYQRLTPRECQVFDMVVAGHANKVVAADLGTAEKTVKVHRARVMEKMEAASLPDLVRMAEHLGQGASAGGD
jgi:FixJ family two-component response regulator